MRKWESPTRPVPRPPRFCGSIPSGRSAKARGSFPSSVLRMPSTSSTVCARRGWRRSDAPNLPLWVDAVEKVDLKVVVNVCRVIMRTGEATLQHLAWLGVVFLALLTVSPPVLAQKRIALVIGNSAYQHTSKLDNPKNDAADGGAALKQLGFEVMEGTDLDKGAMGRTIRDFAAALDGAEVGLPVLCRTRSSGGRVELPGAGRRQAHQRLRARLLWRRPGASEPPAFTISRAASPQTSALPR